MQSHHSLTDSSASFPFYLFFMHIWFDWGHSGVGHLGLLDLLQEGHQFGEDSQHTVSAIWKRAPRCDSLKHTIAGQRAPEASTQVSLPLVKYPAHSMVSVTFWVWALAHTSLGTSSKSTHWSLSGNSKWTWFDAAPARGIAGAPQLGFMAGQVQDLCSVCCLSGLCQAEQHEVVG